MNRIEVNVITGEQKVVELTDDEIAKVMANQPPPPSYKELRAAAYPSIADQLDDIFHNGAEGWKATIQAVKETYPKTGEPL